ncbi:hypothetical protein ACWD4N_15750, partial [Streptomyces sp. NPDC002586]
VPPLLSSPPPTAHTPPTRPWPAAARAASLARTAEQARADAEAAARSSLSGAGSSCTGPRINPALGTFAPGGMVRVSVTCHAALDVPGIRSMDITASSASVVDQYRGDQP